MLCHAKLRSAVQFPAMTFPGTTVCCLCVSLSSSLLARSSLWLLPHLQAPMEMEEEMESDDGGPESQEEGQHTDAHTQEARVQSQQQAAETMERVIKRRRKRHEMALWRVRLTTTPRQIHSLDFPCSHRNGMLHGSALRCVPPPVTTVLRWSTGGIERRSADSDRNRHGVQRFLVPQCVARALRLLLCGSSTPLPQQSGFHVL